MAVGIPWAAWALGVNKGKVERCEIQQFGLLAKAAGAGLEAFGQLEVFPIAGRDHQHIERFV
jgi:hypothetical protein